jgi:16S rRNA U516 pseudouridylate synthase RsuA-like enzyme
MTHGGSEEGVRLQKVLANAGVASRRVCEQYIVEGASG